MRRPFSLLLSVLVVPAALAVPVVHRSAAAPHPVAPHVTSVEVTGLAPVAGPSGAGSSGAGDASRTTTVQSPQQRTARFDAFGASWHTSSARLGTVQVRVRAAGSHAWSPWTTLDPADGGPDPGSADAARAAGRTASEPVWAGPSDAIQTRVLRTDGSAVPSGLTVSLVDPGTSAADKAAGAAAPADSALAATTRPVIYTRAQWGADESLRLHACPSGPNYSSTIKVGFVHHTASPNGYTAAQVPALIRSFYAYHVESNGWCDIGYNFLVDRFGRLWEGRYGGIDKAVIGAHTGGFNVDSFAVSMIGTYSTVTPPAVMQSAIAQLFAWKLGSYYRNPAATDTLVYDGGHYRYCGAAECPVGSVVRLGVVSGHRDGDVGHTSCPGDAGEATLPGLRRQIVADLGAGLVSPSVNATSRRQGDGGVFTVTAGAVTAETWTLTVRNASGAVVRTISGSASAGATITAPWDGLTDAGTPAAAGAYTLVLGAVGATGAALPWSVGVTLHAPVELTGPAQVGYGQTTTLTGSTYPGSQVAIWQAPAGSTTWQQVATVGTAADGSFSYAFPGTSAVATYAQVGGNVSPTISTAIGPSVTGPSYSPPGSVVTLTGTAPPGSAVQVWLQAPGAPATQLATVTAAADGSWATTFTAASTYSWWAVANGLTSPTGTTSITTGSSRPLVSGPSRVLYGSLVRVTGRATPGDTVTLWLHRRGSTGYQPSGTTVAGADGRWATGFGAIDDTRWYAATTAGPSKTVLTVAAPTVAAVARAPRGASVRIHGAAVPGTAVQVYLRVHGRWTRKAVVPVNGIGHWGTTFRLAATTSWYAVDRGLRTGIGRTTPR